uniref:Uncharacterized protein n=1 Tax=Spodoptera litura multicapsid nucleopolyhedrovirus TaxID=46242 RepID=A0A6B9UZ91_NPVST|nr:hypothetical protein [Spodoptera litura nucleopolyhedrovirus]
MVLLITTSTGAASKSTEVFEDIYNKICFVRKLHLITYTHTLIKYKLIKYKLTFDNPQNLNLYTWHTRKASQTEFETESVVCQITNMFGLLYRAR